MRAVKIKTQQATNSRKQSFIQEIYLTGGEMEGFVRKEKLFDYLTEYPGSIRVDLPPYPYLVPARSRAGNKYVRSKPDKNQKDNLLDLPQVSSILS